MDNPYLIGTAAWFFPGAGHLLQGKIARGLILGGCIWLMFIIAVISGGAYYPGFDFASGSLLYLLNFFAKAGNGLGAIISFILQSDPPPNVAAWATFDYGGRFLEVAGLLNFLAIIDALDIYFGRKK